MLLRQLTHEPRGRPRTRAGHEPVRRRASPKASTLVSSAIARPEPTGATGRRFSGRLVLHVVVTPGCARLGCGGEIQVLRVGRDRAIGGLPAGLRIVVADSWEASMDRQALHAELQQAGTTFHQLLDSATDDDFRRRSNGTRWTNEQLLYHMLFGYTIVLALLPLVRLFGRLPPSASRTWARLLDASTRPFDVINYLGAVGGARVYNRHRMGARFDRTLAALSRRLDAEPEANLARTMHFPVRWDPFFKDVMTLEDVYRYPTQHFDFHRAQLTLGGSA